MTWHDGCPLGWLWTHKPGSTEGWASGVLADDGGDRALPRHGVWSCSSACVFSYKTLPSITNQQRNNGSVLWFTRSCMDFPDSPKLVWWQHWLFYVLSHVWILTTSEHLPFSRQKCQRGRNLWTSHPGTEWDLEPKFSKKKKNPDLNSRMATCHSVLSCDGLLRSHRMVSHVLWLTKPPYQQQRVALCLFLQLLHF